MNEMNVRRALLLLLLVAALALVACGGSNESTNAGASETVAVDTPTSAPAEPVVELTEAVIEEPTDEPAAQPTQEPTEQPVDEPTVEAPTEEPPAQPTDVVEETPASQVKPVTLNQLSSDQLTQLSYISGGAAGTYHYGQAEQCQVAENGGLTLTIGGVFSTNEQYKHTPWWGTKETPCEDRLEFGDMIYFVAQGYPVGDQVTFTIRGPLGDEAGSGIVEQVIKADSFEREEYPAARFTWLPSPPFGAGEYTITASGSSGDVSMPVTVHENSGPNFGVKFGADEFHPLLLTPGEKIQMVLTGFPPNHLVSVVLYKSAIAVSNLDIEPGHAIPEDADEPIATLEIQMNEEGYALAELDWPSDLPSGLYSFLVPELIRSEPYDAADVLIPYDPQYGPALYSTQFAFGGPDATWCTPRCGGE